MQRSNLLVFDDYVHPGVATTSQQLNTALGSTNQMAIRAVVDNITGSATTGFMVKIFHSTDGRNWLARILNDIDLSSTTLTAGSYFGYDKAPIPLLAFVQLRITMPAGMAAHVRIHVTGRD